MNGRVLSEEETAYYEKLIDGAYGCAMCTMISVGNHVAMGSSDVIVNVQKKDVQNLIATIRDRNKTIAELRDKVEMLDVKYYEKWTAQIVETNNEWERAETLQQENAILLYALERIDEREIRKDRMESIPYELLEVIRKADAYDDLKTIAREALAKVNATP